MLEQEYWQRKESDFMDEEIVQIIIAMLCMVFAVMIAWRGFFPDIFSGFLIALFTVGISFVGHEMGHKFAAEKFGIYSRFIIWPSGILLMLLFSLLGFIFAAVGAVYIFARHLPKKVNGIISMAGPSVNIIFALIFFIFLALSSIFSIKLAKIVEIICILGLKLNGFIAFFNLIPIPPLDGSKIITWNFGAWITLTVISLVFAFLL